MKKYHNQALSLEIQEDTGYVTSLQATHDPDNMNWILSNSDFGNVDNFKTTSVNAEDDKVVVEMYNPLEITLRVQKYVTADSYVEEYTFQNKSYHEWFINNDSFGIHLPFATNILPKLPNFQNIHCCSHIWCGQDICWIYSTKLSGNGPYLVMNMTQGSIGEYSISRDASRNLCGADYRGDLVLNPAPRVVAPGESTTYKFLFRFTDKPPMEALAEFEGFISVTADRYTARIGEPIQFRADCNFDIQTVSVTCQGETIPVKTDKNLAVWESSFDELGEKKVTVCINGKTTHALVNVIQDLATILRTRTHFIADHQQYLSPGSQLDGAYLAYDSDTGTMFAQREYDKNAGHERIAMGIIILKQLQAEYDQKLFDSIVKHRTFVEREFVDLESGMVYDDVGKRWTLGRIYDFPWFAIYYYEWYALTGDQKYLQNAATILLRYYALDGANQDSLGIEAYRVCTALKKESLNELAETLTTEFMKHANRLLTANFKSESKEVGFDHGMSNCMIDCLIQGYYFTQDKKYVEAAKPYIKSSVALYGVQPDYHLNCISMRHWDRYWFGRYPQYGDTLPHHWSTLLAEALWWYQSATGTDYRNTINTILDGNLCLFRPDGFAYNNYLPAYKVTVFASDPEHKMEGETGSYYGKAYDLRANDQDWILYYAIRYYQE